MHIIRASEIPMELRRPRLNAYIYQMRQALADPNLPQRSRQKLEARLARIRADMVKR